MLARELATELDADILVIDRRLHIAGNCFTGRDPDTGVMVHHYGPHIFNTSNKEVWDYVHRFGEFKPFINRVKASIPQGVFSLPINLHTINQFFGLRLRPDEARLFIGAKADSNIGEPQNFEEQALKFVGQELYEAFFRGYTKKQWGCDPKELPASILKRLPVRFNYDDNYYGSQYQGIPVCGYTEVVRRILDHPRIAVQLGLDWQEAMRDQFEFVFYTGPLDAFYGHEFGRLSYRTVHWERETHNRDFQGNAVINYPDEAVPHTRVHEHKHFAPWESHDRTAVFTEFSKETRNGDEPYYPKRLAADMDVLDKYRARAAAETDVFFLGRLATYRYMDMHHVIGEALAFSHNFAAWKAGRISERPLFAGG